LLARPSAPEKLQAWLAALGGAPGKGATPFALAHVWRRLAMGPGVEVLAPQAVAGRPEHVGPSAAALVVLDRAMRAGGARSDPASTAFLVSSIARQLPRLDAADASDGTDAAGGRAAAPSRPQARPRRALGPAVRSFAGAEAAGSRAVGRGPAVIVPLARPGSAADASQRGGSTDGEAAAAGPRSRSAVSLERALEGWDGTPLHRSVAAGLAWSRQRRDADPDPRGPPVPEPSGAGASSAAAVAGAGADALVSALLHASADVVAALADAPMAPASRSDGGGDGAGAGPRHDDGASALALSLLPSSGPSSAGRSGSAGLAALRSEVARGLVDEARREASSALESRLPGGSADGVDGSGGEGARGSDAAPALTPFRRQHAAMSLVSAVASIADSTGATSPGLARACLAVAGSEAPRLNAHWASTLAWAAGRLGVGSRSVLRGMVGRWHPELGSVAAGEVEDDAAAVIARLPPQGEPSDPAAAAELSAELGVPRLLEALRTFTSVANYAGREGLLAAEDAAAAPMDDDLSGHAAQLLLQQLRGALLATEAVLHATGGGGGRPGAEDRAAQSACGRAAVTLVWTLADTGLLPALLPEAVALVRSIPRHAWPRDGPGVLLRACSRAAVRPPTDLLWPVAAALGRESVLLGPSYGAGRREEEALRSWPAAAERAEQGHAPPSAASATAARRRPPWQRRIVTPDAAELRHVARDDEEAFAAVRRSSAAEPSALPWEQAGGAAAAAPEPPRPQGAVVTFAREGPEPWSDGGGDEDGSVWVDVPGTSTVRRGRAAAETSGELLRAVLPLLGGGGAARLDARSALAALSAFSRPGPVPLALLADVCERAAALAAERGASPRFVVDAFSAVVRALAEAGDAVPGGMQAAWTGGALGTSDLDRAAAAGRALGLRVGGLAGRLSPSDAKSALGAVGTSPLRAEEAVAAGMAALLSAASALEARGGGALRANALGVALQGLVAGGPGRVPDDDVVRCAFRVARAVADCGRGHNASLDLRARQNLLWAGGLAALLRETDTLPWAGVAPSLNRGLAAAVAGFDTASARGAAGSAGRGITPEEAAASVFNELLSPTSDDDDDNDGGDEAGAATAGGRRLPRAPRGPVSVPAVLSEAALAAVGTLSYDWTFGSATHPALRHPSSARRMLSALLLGSRAVGAGEWEGVVTEDDGARLAHATASARSLHGLIAAAAAYTADLRAGESPGALRPTDGDADVLGWPAWWALAAERRVSAVPSRAEPSLDDAWTDSPGALRTEATGWAVKPFSVDADGAPSVLAGAEELAARAVPSGLAGAAMWSGVRDIASRLPALPAWPPAGDAASPWAASSDTDLAWASAAVAEGTESETYGSDAYSPGAGAVDGGAAWAGMAEPDDDGAMRSDHPSAAPFGWTAAGRRRGGGAPAPRQALARRWTIDADFDDEALQEADSLSAELAGAAARGRRTVPCAGVAASANAPLSLDLAWDDARVALALDTPSRYVPPGEEALLDALDDLAGIPGALGTGVAPGGGADPDFELARRAVIRAAAAALASPGRFLDGADGGATLSDALLLPTGPSSSEGPAPAPFAPLLTAWPDPVSARRRLFTAVAASPEASALRLKAPVVAHQRLLEARHWAVGRVPWHLWTRALLGDGPTWTAAWQSSSAARSAARGGVMGLAADLVERLESPEHGRAAAARAASLLADVTVHALLVRRVAARRGELDARVPTGPGSLPSSTDAGRDPLTVALGSLASSALSRRVGALGHMEPAELLASPREPAVDEAQMSPGDAREPLGNGGGQRGDESRAAAKPASLAARAAARRLRKRRRPIARDILAGKRLTAPVGGQDGASAARRRAARDRAFGLDERR